MQQKTTQMQHLWLEAVVDKARCLEHGAPHFKVVVSVLRVAAAAHAHVVLRLQQEAAPLLQPKPAPPRLSRNLFRCITVTLGPNVQTRPRALGPSSKNLSSCGQFENACSKTYVDENDKRGQVWCAQADAAPPQVAPAVSHVAACVEHALPHRAVRLRQ